MGIELVMRLAHSKCMIDLFWTYFQLRMYFGSTLQKSESDHFVYFLNYISKGLE